ncbi:MAG: DegV family protein [Clostridia bacterium]|nr:DegV family protein [Clostridia bacterium]
MNDFKIVTDSSADILSLEDCSYSSAPLRIITAEKEFVDNAELSVEDMVTFFDSYKGKSSTSCPNPEDWLKAFGDHQYIFCMAMTSKLSGSYNAAVIAKEMYESMYPDRKVFVFNSLTTGPELKLIVEQICEQINAGKTFEEICNEIGEYKKKTGLLFLLESMKNLANNGRVNAVVARAAGLLGIRALGRASDEGELQMLDKCRGAEKALITVVQRMKELGWKNGKVLIAHCLNESVAAKLKSMLQAELEQVKIEVYKCRGLCSFYAEKGGLLVGFERC